MSSIITYILERLRKGREKVLDLLADLSEINIDRYLEGALLGWMLLYGLFPIKKPSEVISGESGRVDYYKEIYEETGSEEAYQEATKDRIWLYTIGYVRRYVIMSPVLVFDKYTSKLIPRVIGSKPESIILGELIIPVQRPLLRKYPVDYTTIQDTLRYRIPTFSRIPLTDTLIIQDAIARAISTKVEKSLSDSSVISDIIQGIIKSKIIASKPHTITLEELIQALIRTLQISSLQELVSTLDQYSSISATLSISTYMETSTITDALTPISKSRTSKLNEEIISLVEEITTLTTGYRLVQLTEPVTVLEISLSGRPWEEDPTKTLFTYRLVEIVKNSDIFPVVKHGGRSLVESTTSTSPTTECYQRKAFYAKGRFWVFYSSGGNMVYRTSEDGLTWSDPIIIRPCTAGYRFSIWFDGTYLHYACFAPPYLYYRKGIPNEDGSITWVADEQQISTQYTIKSFHSIAVDSEGYPWIGFLGVSDGNYYPMVIRSPYNDGTFPETVSAKILKTISDSGWRTIIVPLTSRRVVVMYNRDLLEPVYFRAWTGSSWKAERSTPHGMNTTRLWSAVAQDDVVHLIFFREVSPALGYAKYYYASNSLAETGIDGWSSATIGISITIDPVTGDLYIFNGRTDTDYIQYKKYIASEGIWTDWIDWIDESAEQLTALYSLTSFYQAYEGYIGVLYRTKTESPYNVKFAFMSV